MSLGCLILVPSLLKPTDEDAFFKPSWRASFSRCSYALLGPTSSSQSNKGVELVKFTEEFECRYKSTPTNVLRSSKCIGVHDMAHYYGITWLITMACITRLQHGSLLCHIKACITCSLLWHDTPYGIYDMDRYYDMICHITCDITRLRHGSLLWHITCDMTRLVTMTYDTHTMTYDMLCQMTWLVTMTYDTMGVGSSTWSLVFANKSEASGARADLVEQEAS